MAFCSSPEVINPRKPIPGPTNLKVDFFIDPFTFSWKVDFLNAYIHPDDVILIKGLAISQSGRPDSNGCAFADTGQYTVKSGYRIISKFLDKGPQVVPFGPDTNALLSYI